VSCVGNKGVKVKSWKLENVEKTSLANPNTFFIPSAEERKSKNIGDQVRLHFVLKEPDEEAPRTERMWVKITETLSNGYKGVLINQPLYITDLNMGDKIEFQSNNIAQTIVKKGDPLWIDSAEKGALISKLCMQPDGVIRFLYREQPDNKNDSGWRMFSGLETDEYVNDSKNIQIVNVGFLLDKDPSLLEPLKGGFGTVYERQDKNYPWEIVKDWKPED
jgi:hypothetical protein